MKIFRSRVGSLVISGAAISLAMFTTAANAVAGGHGGPVDMGSDYAACTYVERTIYVPTMFKERRVINVTECQPEQRERTVTVNKCVPETKAVREVYTVMVPELRSRTEVYYVCKPVWREVQRKINVQVPTHEQRQGVRQVARQVQVQEMRGVTRDHGHWEEVICEGGCLEHSGCATCCGRPLRRWARGCGGCNACRGCDPCGTDWSCGGDAGCGKPVVHTHQMWRPNLVNEQVPVTVWRTEMVDEPYEFTETVWHTEVRTQVGRVCETVKEEHSRDVNYTVCVPQQHERVRDVTTYKSIAESHVEHYTVMVPHTVQREIEVNVCRMVPKKVLCQVPACEYIPRCDCGW